MREIRTWRPMLVESTTTHVVWVEVEDNTEAGLAAQVEVENGDITGLAESISEDTTVDGSLHASAPDEFDYHMFADHFNGSGVGSEIGPMTRCPECEAVAYTVGYQQHGPFCSQYEHRSRIAHNPAIDVARVGPQRYPERRPLTGRAVPAWTARCLCVPFNAEPEITPWRTSEAEARADLDGHVEAHRAWLAARKEAPATA